jgi:hypothetical protein
LFVLAHTGLTLWYIYLIPRFGHYTKVQEKRSTNIVVLLVRYFIVVEYNTVYTALYLWLKNRGNFTPMGVISQLPFVIYKSLQVLLIGMPYKLIILCKILIKPIYNTNINPYNIFICDLNGLILDAEGVEGWCIYIKHNTISINGSYGFFYKQLYKHNQNLVWVRCKGDTIYHRALRVGEEYIVYTTQETTFGVRNTPTGHLTSSTNQPIYANRNRYEDVEVRVCASQYGNNHNHSMIIQMFKVERERCRVMGIHHIGGKKTMYYKSYTEHIAGAPDLYTQLIHNILNTLL